MDELDAQVLADCLSSDFAGAEEAVARAKGENEVVPSHVTSHFHFSLLHRFFHTLVGTVGTSA